MRSVVSNEPMAQQMKTTRQADNLARRLEQGARDLAAFARSLDETQWRACVPGDGRMVGVIVHHVASVYPLEIELAQKIGGGHAIEGVTMADVHTMNAAHAAEFSGVTKQAALELLERNSAAAAAVIRNMSDETLAQAAPVSLYADAPLTCQFLLEDHAIRHSYHHLRAIKQALRHSR